jgi:hypothetical protein
MEASSTFGEFHLGDSGLDEQAPGDIVPAMQGQKVEAGTPRRLRDEDLRVRHWRRDQFYRLGFTSSDARTLAASGADLTATRELIAHGCDPATAYRIVC